MAPIANRYTSAGALRVRRLPSLIAAAIQVMALGCIVFAAGWFTLETYWPGWRARPGIQNAVDAPPAPAPSSYAPGLSFANCGEAWSAGAAPIQSWEPAYRPEMDGDGDGVACEPFYPR